MGFLNKVSSTSVSKQIVLTYTVYVYKIGLSVNRRMGAYHLNLSSYLTDFNGGCLQNKRGGNAFISETDLVEKRF